MTEDESAVYGDRYELRQLIAKGGMAEVYLAHDRLLDRPVAIKRLFAALAADSSFVERFEREAKAAAKLNHPNIVSVYDWGEQDGRQYLVMEYLEGRSLAEILQSECDPTCDPLGSGNVFVLGLGCFFQCLDGETGKPLWQRRWLD